MPTLTGTLADVTGQPLPPTAVRHVTVKATAVRAHGGGLTTTVPAWIGEAGAITVELQPGPATLTAVLDTGQITIDLLVQDHHTTLHAAALAAHRR